MQLKILMIAILLLVYTNALSLQEYYEQETENMSVLFQDIDLNITNVNYPDVEKLVFLTPWNKKGFQYTIKYANKIHLVSPCWYSFKVGSKGFPIFENQHNYNEQYAKAIKAANPSIKLVPRVYVDGGDVSFYQAIGSDQNKFKASVELIQKIIKEKQFDGIVWDSPYNFYESRREQLNGLITEFIKAVRSAIGPQKLILFNMANPMEHMNSLDLKSYRELPVDTLLIQNYDKGDNYLQMLQKTIEWKKLLGKRHKLMLMVPFFSVKTTTGPLSTE